MESRLIHVDTHVVVWLYQGILELFPPQVIRWIDESSLHISPIVALEIQYLYETKRIKVPAARILEDLETRIGLAQDALDFSHVIRIALKEKWTRDPFDRLIVSQAKARQAPLLTRDQTILRHYSKARWEKS